HPENRIDFNPIADSLGLNGALIRLETDMASPDDRQVLLDDLRTTSVRLGKPVPAWRPRWLPAGAAHHLFGTLRTTDSAADAGVTGPDGRVHGFANLFIAGASRFPAPCSTNPVLAA